MQIFNQYCMESGPIKLFVEHTTPGRPLLFCFPGYGNSPFIFEEMAAQLTEYTVVAIHLPWHGITQWPTTVKQTDSKWAQLLVALQQQFSPQHPHYTLLGYSMGGRYAASIYCHQPNTIDHLFLLAPDGLLRRFWYQLATSTSAGRLFFKSCLASYRLIYGLLSLSVKLGISTKGFLKMTSQYLLDAQERKALYDRWVNSRYLNSHPTTLTQQLNEHKTPATLILGEYDSVIVPKAAKALKGVLHLKIKWIKGSHALYKSSYLPTLISYLRGQDESA